MNARELLDLIDKHASPHSVRVDGLDVKEIILRALRLLAAAEANDGSIPEMTKAVQEGRGIELGCQFERERNGLAARVGELEADAERYQFLRECAVGASAPNETTVTWTIRINDSEYGDFDAAIDAARSKP